MRIFIETNNKYFLLDSENEYSNLENDILKTELINEAMNILEENKLKKEIARQKHGGYLIKKLGINPAMKKST